MKPEEAKAKAKADAIAAGKTEGEAEALGQAAFHKAEADFYKAEAQTAFKERDTSTARLKELEPIVAEYRKLKESGLSDTEKLQKRLQELEPMAKEAETLRASVKKADETIQKLYDIELQGVPEERRKIIPEGLPIQDRLTWLRQAKADGVFGKQTASQGAELPAGQGGGSTIKASDLVAGDDVGVFDKNRSDIKAKKVTVV